MRPNDEIIAMADQFMEESEKRPDDEVPNAIADALYWAADRHIDDTRVTDYLPE